MSGSDGRYMSIDSGPSAVSMARSRVSPNVPGLKHGQRFQQATTVVVWRWERVPHTMRRETVGNAIRLGNPKRAGFGGR